jgi:hypothetical protein
LPEGEEDVSLYMVDDAAKRKTAKGDIYSLGIVLIELGFWCKINSLLKRESRAKMVEDLGFKCGAVYQGVVRFCLARGKEDEEADPSDRELIENIIQDLASLRA